MKYSKLKYIAIGFIVFMFSCKSADQKVTNEQYVTIQNALDSIVAQNEIPGINFSFIDSTNQQENFSSGYENISKKNKLKFSHTMFSGSVGKTYAAAIIFQLIDEERLSYEDKILDYLPNNEWLDLIPNIKDITVRMLLSHTSGLPRWVMKEEVWDILNNEPDKVWSYRDRLSFVFNENPLHTAGKQWAYSDTNYLLLGYLIEVLLNKDYYSVIEERILKPYQLNNTFPSLSRKIERLAFGYSKMPASFKVPHEVLDINGRYVFNPQFEWTGGGFASTTSDLVKWAELYYNSDLITEIQRNKMIEINETGKNVFNKIHSYGMGTFIYNTKYGDAYGHSGFMPGYNTIIGYFPKLKLSCAIQVNCDYASKKIKLTEYLEICVEAVMDKKTTENNRYQNISIRTSERRSI